MRRKKTSGSEERDAIIREYLSGLGRKGGVSTSPAKVAASRENGRRGGRPRKSKPDQAGGAK